MNKKYVFSCAVVLLVVLAASWAMRFFNGKDPAVAELEQFRDETFKKADTMSDDERRSNFEGFREKIQELDEGQRRQFFEASRPMMMQWINQRMDRLFSMEPLEQEKELDRWIDRMEEGRKNREANGGGRRGRDGGEMSQEQRDQRRKERLDRTTPELRAKFDRMKDLINERRAERGLDPIRVGREMFGRPGRPR